MELFIENLNVKNVIYRSDHVSNNLVLKGTLSKDQNELIELLNAAIQNTPENKYPSVPTIL